MNKKIRRNKIIIVSMFIIGIIGLVFLTHDYILSKIRLTFETVNLQLYGNNEPKEVNKEDEPKEEEQTTTEENQTPSSNNTNNIVNNNYVGYLEIPKINLKQGLVDLNNPNNNVNKNIQTIYPSDWPDVENGNLILAAHSGTSSISYFKHLYQLSTNDTVSVYYKGTKYTYKIVNIYNVPKNGQVAIYRNTHTTCITLITCTKNSDTLQTVYIGNLESKEVI